MPVRQGGGGLGGQFSGRVVWQERAVGPPPSQFTKRALPHAADQTHWLPSQLASLRGWYQGNDVSITPIPNWDDESGSGNHITPVFGVDPDLSVSALDGKNAVQFLSANTDFMGLPNGMVAAYTEGAIFFVAKAASNVQMGLPVGRFGTDTTVASDEYNSGGISGVLSSTFLNNGVQTTGATFGDASVWHVAGISSAPSDFRVRKNGTEIYSTAINTVAGWSGIPTLGRGNTGALFNGLLAEVIIFNSALTVAERERVEGYLAHKWNLAAVLDVGHPYKTNPPTVVGGTSYTLTADPAATFVMTGQSAVLKAQRRLAANLQTFALSGQTAALRATRRLTANVGSFALTGQTQVLKAQRKLTANLGTFSLTALNQGLFKRRTLIANLATFSMTGVSQQLTAQRRLTANLVTYALTGQTHTLMKAFQLIVTPASYSLTALSQQLKAQRRLVANLQTFALTGQNVSLRKSLFLSAQLATYAMTTNNVILGYTGGGGGGPVGGVKVTAFFYRI